ncbi:TIGR03960 family B12-binding radical SAM protein [Caldithrix abyssi]
MKKSGQGELLPTHDLEKTLFSKILPAVLKPGRYIGHEINIVQKDAQTVKSRIVLAFPDVYEIGMSYTGFQLLYHILNQQPHIWAERVFAPWPDMEEQLRRHKIPLYSLESFTPLNQFDVIGFTLQYELTYTNILNMLDLGHVPLLSKDRTENDPFVIAGGPCSCNPEPMVDFIDAFLIGDGEEAGVEILNVIQAGKAEGKKREEILFDLAQVWGVYVPQFYEAKYDARQKFVGIRPKRDGVPPVVRTRIAANLKPEHYPTRPIVPLIEVTHDRLAVEVMRGCTEGCRYCNAGMIYRPVRERKVEDILQQIKEGLDHTGYNEVSFLSLSISDYSHLERLMVESRQELDSEVNVSFPSMRLDSFNETIAEFVAQVRKSGFTFAPEAGSQRLRNVINKNISEEDLFKSVEIALQNGWRLIKFYFMIGLPTETDEDVLAIADLLKRLARMSKPYGRIQFNVSISPFSPKAHTPFQWERQNTIEEIWRKVDLLKAPLRGERRVKLSWRDPKISFLEGILGRADRKMAGVIYEVWKNGGKFDGWAEYFNFELWSDILNKYGYDQDELIAEIPESSPLPWDHIDKGVTKRFLQKERHKAYQEKNSPDCKTDHCLACGLQRKGIFAELVDCYKKESGTTQETDIRRNKTKKEVGQPESSSATVKYRVQFTKEGYASFLSHLDMLRIFERAFRRAKIEVAYSEGFNPRPKISFAQPLALGVQSVAEYFDVEIKGGFNGRLAEKLNPLLPEGLKIVHAHQIHEKVRSLSEAIDITEYEIVVLDQNVDLAEVDRRLRKMRRAVSIVMQKRVKGQLKPVNVRPYVDEIRRRGKRILIKVRTIERRSLRINDFARLIFPNNEAIKIIRRKQLIRAGNIEKTPLEILK